MTDGPKIVPFKPKAKPKIRMILARDLMGLGNRPETVTEDLLTLISRITGMCIQEVQVMPLGELNWYRMEIDKQLNPPKEWTEK